MIEYREIIKDDIPKLSKLYESLLLYIKHETRDPYFEFNDLSQLSINDKLIKDIQDKTKKTFIAAENNNIIGFIAGEITSCFLPNSKIDKVGYISAAYVTDEYRNKGIMKELEKMMIYFFKENHLEYMELNVISNNSTGISCWKKLGYNTFREHMRKRI